MSLETGVSFDWGDGTYTFRLGVGEIEELETKLDIGLLRLFRRLSGDDWRLRDFQEVIRLGLIGGGLEPAKALRLVRKYVVPPLLPHREPALRILQPAIIVPDPDLGKSQAEVTAKEQRNGSSHPQLTG